MKKSTLVQGGGIVLLFGGVLAAIVAGPVIVKVISVVLALSGVAIWGVGVKKY